MKRTILITIILTCLAGFCSTAFADISFEVVDNYREEAPHNFVDCQIIQVHGLSDKQQEDDLNKLFADTVDSMVAQYRLDVEESKTLWPDDPEGSDDGPNFGSDFRAAEVTDSEDYYVFKTEYGVLGASYSWLTEFFTFDKKTGKLLSLSDLFGENADYITPLQDYLRGQMEAYNAEHADEVAYWVDEPQALSDSMNNLESYRHWYFDQDGEFVVEFDKYEVAPGAFGTSEFIIPKEILAEIK